MAEVIVIGGGLAGLAAAAALGGAGHSFEVLESRPFLGGRATSYEVGNGEEAEIIDNCQHVLLRCCVNLLDFYRRLGVETRSASIASSSSSSREGGERAALRHAAAARAFRGIVSEAEVSESAEKFAVVRGDAGDPAPIQDRGDLDRISMLDWLRGEAPAARARSSASGGRSW